MKRLTPALAVALALFSLVPPAGAAAAADSSQSSVPVDGATQLQSHTTANCVAAEGRCYFTATANLMTPDGPTGFPGDFWGRQTVEVRSSDRDTWQQVEYSAPAGSPRQIKGANIDNVLSKMYQAVNNVEISVTYFGGGPAERFAVEGVSAPRNWSNGRPATGADFIVCTHIQAVWNGQNLATPSTCSQTRF